MWKDFTQSMRNFRPERALYPLPFPDSSQ
jgi:hypothetical protein